MKKIIGPIEHLEIIDIADEGKSLARHNDLVVFVHGAVPGDIVDAKVISKKRRFIEARATKFHQYSEFRTEPFCKHFGVCGGCKWQNLSYEKQLFFKYKHVKDCLERIAKIKTDDILNAVLPSSNTRYYRNKLEYTFSSQRWLLEEDMLIVDDSRNLNGLGFHIPAKFDKVLDIEHCYLQQEPSNAIRLAVKKFALQQDMTFFDLRKQAGFLRNMIIRSNQAGEIMLIFSFFYDDEKWRIALLDHISGMFPQISSLLYVINSKRNDTISDLEVQLYKGNPYIFEKMENLNFKIGPLSFFQTNTLQAYKLYKIVRNYAGLKGNELVYDLYTGTGTIANFLSTNAKMIIGIEFIEAAVKDAYENASINGFSNLKFLSGDMVKIFNDEFIATHGKPDVIITDPPRAGMHKDVVNRILQIEPSKIVYVSCNPSTQARDIELFSQKYLVTKSQPVDMFPHTHHIENVVLLEKIN